jgi:hypothetical protein
MLKFKIKIFINGITNITSRPTTAMSYDPNARLAQFEETGTEPTVSDFFQMLRHHQEIRREKEREIEDKKNKKRELSHQIEAEELSQSQKRQQKADLMATSKFNVASIMPKVKSLVADKQFSEAEAAGNSGLSVIDAQKITVKGGRRTRRHKKRSGKSGHKRVHKKNKCMSRRR